MTRLEAIKAIRRGEKLDAFFSPEKYGTTTEFLVAVHYQDICDYPRRKRPAHQSIGPIHCLFFSGTPFWIHITPRQLLGFIRRNYPRR